MWSKLELEAMEIRLPNGAEERLTCLEIAKALPEWFNEAGLRAMERDLREEKTFIAVENGCVLGFVTLKPLNEKALEIL